MASMDLFCAACGKVMARVAKSLPQGRATCRACRRLQPHEPKRSKKNPTATCADCAQPMYVGPGSLPQGQARCRACRANSPRRTRRTDKKNACVDCGVTVVGLRCRACYAKTRRIRSDEDSRVKRHQRELAAPGLNSHSRSKLLAKWKRQGKACAYCSRLADTIDHVVPLVRGGTNYEGNLVPCCRQCNGGKAALLLVEWRTGRRLPPMTSALMWQRRQERRRSPLVAVQVELKVCTVCAALHDNKGRCCSHDCSVEEQRVHMRNKYRAKVGIPLDAPVRGRAA